MKGDFSNDDYPKNIPPNEQERFVQLSKLRLHLELDEQSALRPAAGMNRTIVESFTIWAKQFKRQYMERAAVFLITDERGGELAVHEVGASAKLLDWTKDEAVRSNIQTCVVTKQSVHTRLSNAEQGTICADLLPIVCRDDSLLAVFGCMSIPEAGVDAEAAAVGFLTVLEMAVLREAIEHRSRELELTARRRELLYQAARKLYAMIDVDSVLGELIGWMKQLFPQAVTELLLSQDQLSVSLPIKLLSFTPDQKLCTQAFMEGNLQTSTEMSELAAPLVGKQGVYGVIHLMLQEDRFNAHDVEMIRMIAESAGTAFENARLYEQSNVLISELRLINEITKRLNQSLKLNDIFSFACSELIQIFGADFCCILEHDKQRNELFVQASNLPQMFHEHYKIDYGFSGIVLTTREPLIISDYDNTGFVHSRLMELTGSRSLIASPIIVKGEPHGVILVAHRHPNFFSYENYRLLQVLSGHIGLAISNASLHAEVRRMVITDHLTGLYARHYLDEQVSYHQKKDYCGSLIVVDIDNFKTVNDTFGHQVGDKILIQVSHIIRSCIRETDIAARWGGEELAIYLPQVSIEQAVRIAERIRGRVYQETDPRVTVSCGIAEWNWEDERVSVESLFYKSDMALYRAKHEGKNQIKTG